MTVSGIQLEANRKNAQKGGVKTSKGKEIIRSNAVKHGLLAKEIVITIGEGAEDPNEFDALSYDLKVQLDPVGSLEEILVEKIAVAYWRLRRAYKYETGLIRQELDTATNDFYNEKNWEGKNQNRTDEEIEQEIQEDKEEIRTWRKYKKQICHLYESNKSVDDTYDLDDPWDWLHDKWSYLLPRNEEGEITIMASKKLKDFLTKSLNWSEEEFWDALIEVCEDKLTDYENKIATLKQEKHKNKLKLQVINKLGNIPSKDDLDRLLRYEGAIERLFYKALNQLERLQRLRLGDNVPAPIEMNIDVNKGQTA